MERRMSKFWATGGVLTLPGWYTKGYTFAKSTPTPAEPLPTPAELEQFAQQPLEVRQAVEQQGYGFVVSIADSQDKKHERKQQRAA